MYVVTLSVFHNLAIWLLYVNKPEPEGVKISSQKMSYLESPTLVCLFTMQLYGTTMMIKGSLLLSAPIVKSSVFWAKI